MSENASVEHLEVWQFAHAFVLGVYRVSREFPREEVFGLTSQLRRASVSVPANITEGYRKLSSAGKVRYYNFGITISLRLRSTRQPTICALRTIWPMRIRKSYVSKPTELRAC